jgi:transcriptional regulator with XRE-family HTH domain
MKAIRDYLATNPKLTQTAFAAMIGIGKSHLSRILSGERVPSLPLLRVISKKIKVPMDKLLKELHPEEL